MYTQTYTDSQMYKNISKGTPNNPDCLYTDERAAAVALAGPRPRPGRKTFNDEDSDENEDEEGEEDDCGVLIGAVCIVYV